MNLFKIFFLPLLSSLILSCNSNSEENLLSLSGRTMGTTYSVKIVLENHTSAGVPDSIVQTKIDSVLNIVNLQMSTYIDTSEISRFNSLLDTNWFRVSPDLGIVLKEALKICSESGGSFDITIGPVVNLWGFGPPSAPDSLPTDSEIQNALKQTGWENLRFSESPPSVKKMLPEIYCDLSAIAKGFGVDKVALLLEKLGFENYLVEIGGEVRTRGINQNENKWRVGVLSPEREAGIYEILSMSDLSMATSGDYFNFFEINGVKYSHTIDPRTGRPVVHHLASVTVLHPSCMTADAYATALSVMGPEKGYEFATSRGLSALFIIRENGKFVEKKTPQFEKSIN